MILLIKYDTVKCLLVFIMEKDNGQGKKIMKISKLVS